MRSCQVVDLTDFDNEVLTTYYNSMGLPAKLHSSQLGNIVDGTVNFHLPATAEQIIARRYDDTLAETVRPWPGDISQIEVPTIYVR